MPDALPPVHRSAKDARWFQYGLRALFVLCVPTTIVGVLFHWEFLIGTVFTLFRWPLFVGLLFCAFWSFAGGRRRMALFAAGALALLVGDALVHLAERPSPERVSGNSMELKLLSYNVLVEGGAPDLVMDTLEASGVDVLALQEAGRAWPDRLRPALLNDYPYQLFQTEGQGLALLSRYPMGHELLLKDDYSHPFAQCADVLLPTTHVVTVCSVHLESPSLSHLNPLRLEANSSVRRKQWRYLEDRLAEALPEDRTVLLAGDFNTMDEDPLYRTISSEWVDLFRAVTLRPGTTWPNVKSLATPIFRIDYVFARGPALPVAATVLHVNGSDHLPVAVKLQL
ncbi:MAG: endonuclease/exonuclease/phosphatase family protein [Myxococcaceae bacterium]